MATFTKFYSSFGSAKVRTRRGKDSNVLSVRAFIDLFAKSLRMAHVTPKTGRVSAKDMAKVRRIADTL